MTFISKRRARMLKWMDDNPNVLYSSGYDETISDEQAGMILAGDFDGFDQSMDEIVWNWELDGYVWDHWEGEFSSAFGFDSWDVVPESVQDFARENRTLKTEGWTCDMIRHWHGNITATILKPGAKEPENLIYAPSAYCEASDRAFARYLVDAFGLDIKATGGPLQERVWRDLEVIYGGYDMEHLILCGRVDLLAIYEARTAPERVKIGPEDADHLLFYDFHNGCGNMGQMHITKNRTMPAELRVDGTRGYGVDSCYGFTGDWWRHEIRVA